MSADTAPASAPRFRPGDPAAMATLALLSLILHAATGMVAAWRNDLPLPNLALFFDGHMYLEIAKSFPLPYAPEGGEYLGQAPGYPALIATLRALVPDVIAGWGTLALWAAWLPAALSAVAFYALCRTVGTPPLWPTALFVVANPRWVSMAGHGFPEPWAMLLALLALLAYLNERLGWCMIFLAAATLTRFPALLLGLAIAFDALVLRRAARPRTVALLTVPPLIFAAWNLYLFFRAPGFRGVWNAHQIFWETHATWPFAELLAAAAPSLWPNALPAFGITYAFVALCLAAIVVGFRRTERSLWILPAWVAVIVISHASLSGVIGARDFTRLAILAWPAALLILWRAVGAHLPAAIALLLCIASGAFSMAFAQSTTFWAISLQRTVWQPLLFEEILQNLEEDTPRWPHVLQDQ